MCLKCYVNCNRRRIASYGKIQSRQNAILFNDLTIGANLIVWKALPAAMKQCISCKGKIDDDSRFCKACGARQGGAGQDSVGALIDDAIDTTVRVTKTVAKEGIRVSKKVARKVKDEIDRV